MSKKKTTEETVEEVEKELAPVPVPLHEMTRDQLYNENRALQYALDQATYQSDSMHQQVIQGRKDIEEIMGEAREAVEKLTDHFTGIIEKKDTKTQGLTKVLEGLAAIIGVEGDN